MHNNPAGSFDDLAHFDLVQGDQLAQVPRSEGMVPIP